MRILVNIKTLSKMELSELLGLILLRPLTEDAKKRLAVMMTKIISMIQIQTCIANFNLLVSCIRLFIKSIKISL